MHTRNIICCRNLYSRADVRIQKPQGSCWGPGNPGSPPPDACSGTVTSKVFYFSLPLPRMDSKRASRSTGATATAFPVSCCLSCFLPHIALHYTQWSIVEGKTWWVVATGCWQENSCCWQSLPNTYLSLNWHAKCCSPLWIVPIIWVGKGKDGPEVQKRRWQIIAIVPKLMGSQTFLLPH